MKSKIMDIKHYGRFICIYDDTDKVNPYRLYRITWDGGRHRKLIAKYADFNSVICCVYQNRMPEWG